MSPPPEPSPPAGDAPASREVPLAWVVAVADRLVGIEALVNDMLDGQAAPIPTWQQIDRDMAEMQQLLEDVPPDYQRIVRLAGRYDAGWSPRRKRRVIRKLGVAFFRVSGYALYLEMREQNVQWVARRWRTAGTPADLDPNWPLAREARVHDLLEDLAGVAAEAEPDWWRVHELAALVSWEAQELAGR